MAERRMFTKKITESDAFLDMPLSTQCLYFHLNMAADDDGFVNNPRKIQRMVGASEDDMKLLIAKSFIIQFDSGIIVIKHWKMHNYIAKDRYKPTDYKDEKSMLQIKDNKAYTLDGDNLYTECRQDVDVGKDRLGKDRLGKYTPSSAPGDSTESTRAVGFLLSDDTEYVMTENDVVTYQQLYPLIDVRRELKKITAWCYSNPEKRKPRSRAKQFLNGWLLRAQNEREQEDRQKASGDSPQSKKRNGFCNFKEREYDFDELEKFLLTTKTESRTKGGGE